MSIESAKAYVERMKTDEEFRKKVLAIEDSEKRMQFVKAEGFDFSSNDIKVVLSVIDDKELRQVVGGANTNCRCWELIRAAG